jgi:hypothetical protein
MAFSRYARTPLLNLGEQYGTAVGVTTIRRAIAAGTIKTREIVLRGAERLDTLAGSIYGDGRYYWILAAASDIGWAMQIPPGTIIVIPDLNDVAQAIA